MKIVRSATTPGGAKSKNCNDGLCKPSQGTLVSRIPAGGGGTVGAGEGQGKGCALCPGVRSGRRVWRRVKGF
jgi:hypothetical protein